MKKVRISPYIIALIIFTVCVMGILTFRYFSDCTPILGEVSDNSFKQININSATQEELCMLPGIGKTLASKIIYYRNLHGNFNKLEDLDKVDGIGQSVIEKIRDYITFSN